MSEEKPSVEGPIINTAALRHQTGTRLSQISKLFGQKSGLPHKLATLAAKGANKLGVETELPAEPPKPAPKEKAPEKKKDAAGDDTPVSANEEKAEKAPEGDALEPTDAPAEEKAESETSDEPEAEKAEPAPEAETPDDEEKKS